MKARGAATAVAAALLLPLLGVVAAKDEPTIKVHNFDTDPVKLEYFIGTDILLLQDYASNIYRSADGGETWDEVQDIPRGKADRLIVHEADPSRAYVLTPESTHYKTLDKGKTWTKFFTDAEPNYMMGEVLQFHATDPDRIIYNGVRCISIFCEQVSMYTLDGFKTDAEFLRDETEGCWWAKSNALFTTGKEDLDKQRILCAVQDTFSPFKSDNRLVISDNYFSAQTAGGDIQEFEPNLNMDRAAKGVINLAAVKKSLLVATTSANTDEMALYVTDDTINWHRAMFPTDHVINQEAYTVLESTNYSIQIDVETGRRSNPTGTMFTSNSNGTFFTSNLEGTNRNIMGHVDFEKIAGIQGIFLVNTVDNYKDVQKKSGVKKEVVSVISHDDGRTFAPVTADKERVHLHSVTELDNIGRVFSSPAPGLVMGNGNTGKFLKKYDDANLFVSDDAGMTWTQGLKGPHKYEFGDQGSVLLAISDSPDADISEINYSLDHGQTWKTVDLPDKLKVRPWILTTTPDSTSLKFVLVARSGSRDDPKFPLIFIDFEGLHERTCGKDDIEEWWARVDDDGKPTCLMGHTQSFERRKKDADCFLKQEFNNAQVITTKCECTDLDFECDFNFRRNDKGECIRAGPIIAPEEACQDGKPDATFQGSSGWRKIPGNDCERTGGKQKDDTVERKCSESINAPSDPASGNITVSQKVFGKYAVMEKHYLLRGDSSSSQDETVIARGQGSRELMITHNHGQDWEEIKDVVSIDTISIVSHTYFKDMVFFLPSRGEKIMYTVNRGRSYDSFQAPTSINVKDAVFPLYFHPDKKDHLIWVGQVCKGGNDCYNEASLSTDRGDHWTTLKRYVRRCEFVGSSSYRFRDPNQILCLARKNEDTSAVDNPWQLVGSSDVFDTETVYETDVKDFATMSEFIVTAVQNTSGSTLQALTSLDGKTYAQAHFPYGFTVNHQRAYTVLDSSTHAVNLFVAEETKSDQRFGSILKSNSNGTSYVVSISGVNCDEKYYVDFEKMLGLEGVVLVNTVANMADRDLPKKFLQTKISHNDGAEWAFVPPPEHDLEMKPYCQGERDRAKCALHIQGYTQRENKRNTYSSAGAVGLMFGWGNVGEYLGEAKDADTFMTTDAGISWTQVKTGRWTWQFGDQGSILVLVRRHAKTRSVSYTLDEGITWKDQSFAEEDVMVEDITTMSSGTSRKFIVWGVIDGGKQAAYTIDFSGLSGRECKYDEKDSSASDYRLWSPSHPLQADGCLFGHKTQYLRKKPDRECYNGYKIEHLYNTENCACNRRDYECDYNYQLDAHGQCQLVEGLKPQDHIEWCKSNPDAIEYYEPTGYRRIPLTTCVGHGAADEMDKVSEVHPCPGKEDEFNQKHGVSGLALFFAVTIPFALAAAAGYWVWKNWANTPFSGQIRLGDTSSSGGHSFGQGAFESDSPLIKYPIIVVSAAVAVVGALPLVLAGLWRTGSSLVERWRDGRSGSGSGSGGRGAWSRVPNGSGRRFTTRDSFARERGDYAVAGHDVDDDDEGELLGEDSDDEV